MQHFRELFFAEIFSGKLDSSRTVRGDGNPLHPSFSVASYDYTLDFVRGRLFLCIDARNPVILRDALHDTPIVGVPGPTFLYCNVFTSVILKKHRPGIALTTTIFCRVAIVACKFKKFVVYT